MFVFSCSHQDVGLMKTYISKIQQLESEVTRQKFSTAYRNGLHDRLALDKGILLDDLGSGCEAGTPATSKLLKTLIPRVHDTFSNKHPSFSGEVDEEEKEREHSSLQEKLDKELQDLDQRLQQKEVLFFLLMI
jgi:kinesin family protein 4/21/27